MIAFVNSSEFRGHRNGPYHSGPEHPETPRRLDAIEGRLQSDGFWKDLRIEAPVAATFDQLSAVHDPAYVRAIEAACAQGPAALDEDTGVVPASHRAALLAAGGACQAVDLVVAGDVDGAFCAVRPPGHHAERSTAMGFCLFNNVAVAAEHARRAHGLSRIAIIDWDVHHGNGTQHIFYQRGDVFTVSIHADPIDYYPFYWGSADEEGDGQGAGCNLNLPLPLRFKDDLWLSAFDIALTRISDFGPGAVVVALGLDAHEADPLQGGAVSQAGFARAAEAIASLGLPTVLVQEGGYLTEHLPDNLAMFLTAFEGAHGAAVENARRGVQTEG